MTQTASNTVTEQETSQFLLLLCPTCKNPITEQYKDDIQTIWYKCKNKHQTTTPDKQAINSKLKEKTQKTNDDKSENNHIELQHINEIENPKCIGTPVTIQAVISSTSTAYTVPSIILADLQEEDQENTSITPRIPLEDPINLSLIAVSEETKNSRLNKYLKTNYPNFIKRVFIEVQWKTSFCPIYF